MERHDAPAGFEWDRAKSAANERKHGVSFQEAISVFANPRTVTIPDEHHSEVEDRSVSIGVSALSRVIVVITTERYGKNNELTLRVISARKATKHEKTGFFKIIKDRG